MNEPINIEAAIAICIEYAHLKPLQEFEFLMYEQACRYVEEKLKEARDEELEDYKE